MVAGDAQFPLCRGRRPDRRVDFIRDKTGQRLASQSMSFASDAVQRSFSFRKSAFPFLYEIVVKLPAQKSFYRENTFFSRIFYPGGARGT